MIRGRSSVVAILAVLALSACDNGGGTSGSGGASASGTGAGGSGGAGGGAAHPPDPCQAFGDRASCCAQTGCGWHHNIGHTLYYDVGPCVSSELVCEVEGMKVRDCPDGMICHVDGGWSTEDDCAALPPPGQIHLNGRGICVWPTD